MPDRDATLEIARLKKDGQFVFRLLNSQVAYDEMADYSPLAVEPPVLPALTDAASVGAYGAILRTALCEDKNVQAELDQLFLISRPDQAKLRFQIGPSDGERYRWEAICSDVSKFLAVSGDCSMSRIAEASQASVVRLYELPIRIGAFLSPAGFSSMDELKAIASAVSAGRKSGLDIEAHFFLGEQNLLDQDAAGKLLADYSGCSAFPIPNDAVGFEKALQSASYQIIHFFCHGRVDADVQLLEFASINDHDIQQASGSINLSLERLKQVISLSQTVWVVVLNSCSGAEVVPRLHSMARVLAKSACPITIGMAETIDIEDATMFAENFYARAIPTIYDAIRSLSPGEASNVDFGPAVAEARRQLHEAGKVGPDSRFARWCLPIHYERARTLRIVLNVCAEARERISQVAQALRGLPASTPPEIRESILGILDKDPAVPAGLRPDRFGNLA